MFTSLIGPCVLPLAIVHQAQKMTDALKAAEKAKEFMEKTLPYLITVPPQVVSPLIAGAAVGIPLLKLFAPPPPVSSDSILDDYVEFGRMIIESRGGVLLDFAEFLGEKSFEFFLGDEDFWKESSSTGGLLECMGAFATFAVYPDVPDCGIPSPQLEITTDDVKDFAKDAAMTLVPALGLIL